MTMALKMTETRSSGNAGGREGIAAMRRAEDGPVETKTEFQRRIALLEEFRDGVLAVLSDMEDMEKELDEAGRKLKDTEAQLIQSNKMTSLGELAAGVVHELNQPLTVIIGLAQNLIKDAETEGIRAKKLKLIDCAAKRMDVIIRHLRAFSRAEDESAEFEPIDLNDVIKNSTMLTEDMLVGNSIALRQSLGAIPLVNGSPNKLEQVVINLVTNAVDAMGAGGSVEIRTEPHIAGGLSCVRLIVEDSGPGIPADVLGRIFDPFFTTKGPGKGMGLGLSISYGIIKEHRGEIIAANRPEGGASFCITLPAMA